VPNIVGILFQSGGKVHYFDSGDLDLARGEYAMVQTPRGTEMGEVVEPMRAVPDEEVPAPMKRVLRRAGTKDHEAVAQAQQLRREAMTLCRRMIADHGLPMKVVDAEVAYGGSKITISFFAEERVDFRGLVSDLGRALETRIELRQIGAREEARLVGGLGPCGRALCCVTFPVSQDPVSIRMAKDQSLPLNPMKISGLCGRLMCCLKYEQGQYAAFRKEAPRCGTVVQTDGGEGVVIGYQVPKDSLTVRFEDGTMDDVPIEQCSCGGHPCRYREPDEAGVVDAGEAALPAGVTAGQAAADAEVAGPLSWAPPDAEVATLELGGEEAPAPPALDEGVPVSDPEEGAAESPGDGGEGRRRGRRRRRRPRGAGGETPGESS